MKSLAVAIYARVSSDQQTEAHTIASQLERAGDDDDHADRDRNGALQLAFR